MKKIGIFAGTFDPIHDGHIEVAKSSVEHLGLDLLYFMVEKNPWTSKQPVDLEHRQKMVQLAIHEIANFLQFEVEDERFSIETTLPKIEQKHPDDQLYFIFGADVFMQMSRETWPGLQKLLKHHIVVFERGDVTEIEISQRAKTLGIVTAIIPSKHPNHASTNVRLSPHQKEIWVPKKVAQYIESSGLY